MDKLGQGIAVAALAIAAAWLIVAGHPWWALLFLAVMVMSA